MSTTDNTMHLKEGVVVTETFMDEVMNQPKFQIHKDEGMAILCFQTNEEAVVTVKSNESVFGGKDLSVSVPKGRSYCAFHVGPYLQLSGPNKGKILLTTDNYSITATLIALS